MKEKKTYRIKLLYHELSNYPADHQSTTPLARNSHSDKNSQWRVRARLVLIQMLISRPMSFFLMYHAIREIFIKKGRNYKK